MLTIFHSYAPHVYTRCRAPIPPRDAVLAQLRATPRCNARAAPVILRDILLHRVFAVNVMIMIVVIDNVRVDVTACAGRLPLSAKRDYHQMLFTSITTRLYTACTCLLPPRNIARRTVDDALTRDDDVNDVR